MVHVELQNLPEPKGEKASIEDFTNFKFDIIRAIELGYLKICPHPDSDGGHSDEGPKFFLYMVANNKLRVLKKLLRVDQLMSFQTSTKAPAAVQKKYEGALSLLSTDPKLFLFIDFFLFSEKIHEVFLLCNFSGSRKERDANHSMRNETVFFSFMVGS